jgi:hypothetical protein
VLCAAACIHDRKLLNQVISNCYTKGGRDEAALLLLRQLVAVEKQDNNTAKVDAILFTLEALTERPLSVYGMDACLLFLFNQDADLTSQYRHEAVRILLQPLYASQHPPSTYVSKSIVGKILRRCCHLGYPNELVDILRSTDCYPAEDGDWCVEFYLRLGDFGAALDVLHRGVVTGRGVYWAFQHTVRMDDAELLVDIVRAAQVDDEILSSWRHTLKKRVSCRRVRRMLKDVPKYEQEMLERRSRVTCWNL